MPAIDMLTEAEIEASVKADEIAIKQRYRTVARIETAAGTLAIQASQQGNYLVLSTSSAGAILGLGCFATQPLESKDRESAVAEVLKMLRDAHESEARKLTQSILLLTGAVN